MQKLSAGDWVQATEQITEEDFMGRAVWTHAECGGIGHVMGVDGEWATITFERTGTTTACHYSEFKRLCGAMAGKTPEEAV